MNFSSTARFAYMRGHRRVHQGRQCVRLRITEHDTPGVHRFSQLAGLPAQALSECSRREEWVVTGILVSFLIFGLIGNLLSATIMFRRSRRGLSSYFYLAFLAIVDIVFCTRAVYCSSSKSPSTAIRSCTRVFSADYRSSFSTCSPICRLGLSWR